MIKWQNPQENSKQCSQQPWIILTLLNPHQPRRIHQSLCNLPLWYQLIVGLHHWTVESLQKLVACGISNMRSAHQYYMNYSSIQNSKDTLLLKLRTYTTTTIFFLMRWLESNNNFFLFISTSIYTMSLHNTSSHIMITLTILRIFIYKTCLDTHCSGND